MLQNNIFKSFIVIVLITINTLGYSQMVGPWNLDDLYKVPEWEVTELATKDGVKSLLFSSLDYLDNPVQVFAYYSAPEGEMPEGGWPAMVHAHGGGGTAYSQWVTYFNEHGHAAISLDLEGHIPTEDENGAYLASPNPGPSRSGIFNDYEKPFEEQWYYHAIAQVILGHTLIASFPEVNADKIGVSGASWGGTITSTVMGVDNRWAWAVPVYGAGYLDDTDGNQGEKIDGDKATFVNQYYDASVYFDRVDFPALFINGTNDYNFAMPCNQRSAQHVNDGQLRFSLGFGHSNLAPLRLDELFTFANQVSYDGDELPNFDAPTFNANNVASVNVTAEAGLNSAELLYTTNDGYWYEREWLSIPATISGNTITANLPEGTTTFYFTATDSRGLFTTSEYVETDDSSIPSGNPNIAVYGAASQSSTDYDGEASRAIDQNTNGEYTANSVTHTLAEDNAWWQVELVGSHNIDEVVIFNRTDATSKSRLTNFTVYVINSNGETTFSQSFTSYPDPSVTIYAGGADGHIIKIQLDAIDTPLSLAEVEVYEVENTGISVTDVNVTPESASVLVGNTLLLTTTVSPANASDQSVNWRSSNPSVASVDEVSGLVTAHSVGSAIITATTTDSELTDNCTVTVTTSTSVGNDYFKKSYGIFVHYGWGGTEETEYGCQITQYADGSFPQSLDETADNFDVQGFVDDIAAMSPEYLIFTIWHCGMNPLYPSDVMEKWLGSGHSSKRDVMQELLDACEEKGIDVYFYTQPSAGNSMSPESQVLVDFINNSKYTVTYNDFINELYSELTTRYQTQLKGFWFDKGLGFGCVDEERLGKTIKGILPNAVVIKNGFASDAPVTADFGAVEIMSVTANFEGEGYTGANKSDEGTWPAFERSISFVSDRAWFSQPGSIRYTSEMMYKYTVLEAGVNKEGGGVAWALGPYPTTTISWNNNVLSRMASLGEMIDEVGESIKSTIPSASWPTAEGTTINDLDWGIATRSADGDYEYLHVLKAPAGNTLTIAAPADGKEYSSAINLRTGNSCGISQTANKLTITLNANDSWDAVDAVFKLSNDLITSSSDNVFSEHKSAVYLFPNPTKGQFNIVGAEGASYQLFNINGNLHLEGSIESNSQKMSTEGLSSGVYLIKITKDESVSFLKFLLN